MTDDTQHHDMTNTAHITNHNNLLGKLHYQASGIFSLNCVLFQWLISSPFKHSTVASEMKSKKVNTHVKKMIGMNIITSLLFSFDAQRTHKYTENLKGLPPSPSFLMPSPLKLSNQSR